MKILATIGLMTATGLALLLSSCATGGGTSPSGFLSDFGQLGGGRDSSGALASYLNPEADFRYYDSILLDPVTTIVSRETVDPRVVEQLAADLSKALRGELGKDLRMVDTPGPRTMRVRVALTDVIADQPAVNPVRTVHAAPRARLQGPVGDAAGFIASVSFEGEVLDSMTGKRLSALSDQRLGSKREVSPATDWVAVRTTIDESAAGMSGRLFAAQSR